MYMHALCYIAILCKNVYTAAAVPLDKRVLNKCLSAQSPITKKTGSLHPDLTLNAQESLKR